MGSVIPSSTVGERVTHATFVERMIESLSTALLSDSQSGYTPALKIKNRLDEINNNSDQPGRNAVEARFALAFDDDKYLSMGVFPLWASSKIDERIALVPSGLQPLETRQATASGILLAFSKVIKEKQVKTQKILQVVLRMVSWLFEMPEIRTAAIKIAQARGKLSEARANLITGDIGSISNMITTDIGQFEALLESLYMLLAENGAPMLKVRELEDLVNVTCTNVSSNTEKMLKEFAKQTGEPKEWCNDDSSGTPINKDMCGRGSAPSSKEKSAALHAALDRFASDGNLQPNWKLDANITPLLRPKERVSWYERYPRPSPLVEPYHVKTDNTQDANFVTYALLRGICGQRGPHQTFSSILGADELMYSYPSRAIYDSKQEPNIVNNSPALAQSFVTFMENESSNIFGMPTSVINDIALHTLRKDDQNLMVDGQEPARQVTWGPFVKSDKTGHYVVVYDAASKAMCKTATYEHMITTLRQESKKDQNNLLLVAATGAAKLAQLETMAYVVQNLWNEPASSNNMLIGALKKPKSSFIPITDVPKTDFLATRPPIVCDDNLIYPVDAGIAYFSGTSESSMPPFTKSPKKDHGEATSIVCGNVISNAELTKNLRRSVAQEIDLFVGMPSWEQACEDAKDRDKMTALGVSKVGSQDVSLAKLRNVVIAGLRAIKDSRAIESENSLIKKFNEDGSEERKRVFNISTDIDANSRDRRSGLWEDARREIAVSTDRLLVFVRTLSGMLGETVESILVGDDPELAVAQKALKDRRRDAVNRAMQFQSTIVESVMKSALQDSKIQLDIETNSSGSPNLVLSKTIAKDIIKDLASGESGRPFFNAQVELNNALQNHTGPIGLVELVQQLSQIGNEYANAVTSRIGNEAGLGVSNATLSMPRNSYMVRLKADAYAAIRRAYQRLNNQIKHHSHYMRHIALWEYIEGKSMDLTTSFCELVSYELQNMRMSSTGLSAYVGQKQLTMNNVQRGISLNRIINTICDYSQKTPKPDFLNKDGRTIYFGGDVSSGKKSPTPSTQPSKSGTTPDGGNGGGGPPSLKRARSTPNNLQPRKRSPYTSDAPKGAGIAGALLDDANSERERGDAETETDTPMLSEVEGRGGDGSLTATPDAEGRIANGVDRVFSLSPAQLQNILQFLFKMATGFYDVVIQLHSAETECDARFPIEQEPILNEFCKQYGKTEINKGRKLIYYDDLFEWYNVDVPDVRDGNYIVDFEPPTGVDDKNVSDKLNGLFGLSSDTSWTKDEDSNIWRRPYERTIFSIDVRNVLGTFFKPLKILVPKNKLHGFVVFVAIIVVVAALTWQFNQKRYQIGFEGADDLSYFQQFIRFAAITKDTQQEFVKTVLEDISSGVNNATNYTQPAGLPCSKENLESCTSLGNVRQNSRFVFTRFGEYMMNITNKVGTFFQSSTTPQDEAGPSNITLTDEAGPSNITLMDEGPSNAFESSMDEFFRVFYSSSNYDNYQIYDERFDTVYLADRL